jgi:PAS domain S-box-containing protein
VDEILRRVGAGEVLHDYPARIRCRDGSIKDVAIDSSACRADGQFIHTQCFTRDVTSQQETNLANARLAAIVASSADAIVGKMLDGTVTNWNTAAERIFGYSAEEMIGQSIFRLIPPEEHDAERELLRRLARGESVQFSEAQRITKDGRRIFISLSVSPIRDASGRVVGASSIKRDITGAKEAREILTHANERLAAIVASSADAIVGKTLDGTVTNWNAAAERIFGYSAEEMVGQPIFRLIPPELHDSERMLLQRLTRGEAVEFSEAERITKDGRHIFISLSVSPIRDASGRVVGASSIKRDITEAREARAELTRSRERLQLALRAARMGTWRWDPATDVVSWDDGLYQIFGIGPNEEKVTRYEEFLERVHEDDRLVVREAVERALDGGGDLNYEFRIVLPSGTNRWLADQGRVVRDSEGKTLYVTGVTLDITDRKLVQERLRQAQRMDSVGQLAGGIAHEANNMMSVVLGCADYVLQRNDLPEPVRQDVDQIWRAAKRTAGITQQLLAFSRRQVLQPQILDLNTTIRDLEVILSRALGEDRAVRLHLSPNLGQVRADPGQLEQVLINLTLNARDAMDAGGRLTIETMNVVLDQAYVAGKSVESLEPGEYAAVVVTDTGHGMDRATLGRIFEPFFTTKDVGEGTGLGLSTVYGIVKQSGGYIWVYSEPGLGTTFKLYFPLVAQSQEASVPQTPTPGGRVEEVVLVVEDEPMVRSIMARTLRDCGYGVLEAANGREALAVMEAHEGRIALIVVDVVMPDIGGRDMANRVAQRWPDVPVLFTSGYTGLDVVRRGLLEEGREFVQKPLAPEALARKVREMVDAKQPVE